MKPMNNTRGRRPKDTKLYNQLMNLKVGEYINTNNPEAVRLAGSLSRTTKRNDGTRFATRLMLNGNARIKRVISKSKHENLSLRKKPLSSIRKPKMITIATPEPQLQMDAADILELNALRDLMKGFLHRLDQKAKCM